MTVAYRSNDGGRAARMMGDVSRSKCLSSQRRATVQIGATWSRVTRRRGAPPPAVTHTVTDPPGPYMPRGPEFTGIRARAPHRQAAALFCALRNARVAALLVRDLVMTWCVRIASLSHEDVTVARFVAALLPQPQPPPPRLGAARRRWRSRRATRSRPRGDSR